ncbi:hypothetical protein GCM10009716_33390 [Streptomyces sodiiphilus]|uniref:Uncharacterized protein n=1 Tax=Streptomyces sodiiphilus TaxID=226217 RepID=A0ABP5AT75_9ACTN
MRNGERTIPPTSDHERATLEREADRIISGVPDDCGDPFPEPWKGATGVSSFETLNGAHAGFAPLALTGMIASYPDFDPIFEMRELESLMSAVPHSDDGNGRRAVLAELVDLGGFSFAGRESQSGEDCGICRWKGCGVALYAPGQPRGRGKPRKYCPEHQKAARAHTARLRRAGLHLGKHRNLVYDFPGLDSQELQGYRDIWAGLNRAATAASL